jgi:peroxiredoxin
VPTTLPKKADGTADSTFPYRYYKSHYWDFTDLTDGRLVRTPVFENKLQKYFSQLVVPEADSINAEADRILAKARPDKEMFKFVLWWLTNTYETSPYMGMDAVFVHLVEKYYVAGDATWLTEDQKNKIISRAYTIAPNLIGQPAAPLVLEDTTGKPVSLYNIKGKYTILVFWDPTCGHCKTEIPRIDSAYKAIWKDKGIALVGVKTEGTKDEYVSFIKQHKLTGWTHTLDPQNKSNYRRLYDVYSTPVVYLLDEKKKIIAKRLGVEQLIGFLQHLDTQSSKTASK